MPITKSHDGKKVTYVLPLYNKGKGNPSLTKTMSQNKFEMLINVIYVEKPQMPSSGNCNK